MEKTVRVTKAMRFTDIAAMLEGKPVTNGTTVQDALDFIQHEVDLLNSKNSAASKRKDANRAKDDVYKSMIVDFLATLDPNDAGKTCSEIGKSVDGLADFNTSKMSSLCNSLVKDGTVVKSKGKGGASLFKLA